MNMDVQSTPAAACPLYIRRRRKNINLNEAMEIRAQPIEFN